jgi:hypothetical protein
VLVLMRVAPTASILRGDLEKGESMARETA